MTRHDAIKHLSYKIAYCKSVDENWADAVNVEALEIATRALQKQEPEQKKGKWIKHEDDERISGTCSCCGWDALLYETDIVGMPFCPNCGAEMEGEE